MRICTKAKISSRLFDTMTYRSNHTQYNDQRSTHHKTSTKFRSHWLRKRGGHWWQPRCDFVNTKWSIPVLSFCHRYCIITNTITHDHAQIDDSSQVSWAAIHPHVTPTVSFSKKTYVDGYFHSFYSMSITSWSADCNDDAVPANRHDMCQSVLTLKTYKTKKS